MTDPISRIHQAIGSASMCWAHVERAGIFDEAQAIKVADSLIDDLLAMGALRHFSAAYARPAVTVVPLTTDDPDGPIALEDSE